MNIYIDESGSFIPATRAPRVSCVVALAVRTVAADALATDYVALRGGWTDANELKGSAMSDAQLTAALQLLAEHRAFALFSAADSANHTTEAIKAFRAAQGQAFEASLTAKHGEVAQDWVRALRTDWDALSPQLACQVFAHVTVVEDLLRHGILFAVQRWPEELGQFNWIVDPKEPQPTRYERVWRKLVVSIIQTRSLKEPMATVQGWDYSAMDRFRMPLPDYLRPHILPQHRSGLHLNINPILSESVSFPSSADSPGLQLADVVASAFTRAMNRRLAPEVWRLLGPLCVQHPSNEQPAVLFALGDGPAPRVTPYQAYVLQALKHRAQRMFHGNDPPARPSS